MFFDNCKHKRISILSTKLISVLVLFSFSGCTFDIGTSKTAVSGTTVKTVVSKCIEQEMDTILPYMDDDTQTIILSGNINGKEIVTKALNEDGGKEYVDFCYSVNRTLETQDASYMMRSAKQILSQEQYNDVEQKITDAQYHLGNLTREISKTLPADQQEAFYSDLRALVIKTAVLAVAGIVYATMPNTIVWGKVSAAAALAVSAGIVSGVVMDIYGHYVYGFDVQFDLSVGDISQESFGEWLKQFKDEPEAAYALATSVVSIATTMELDPITTGIILVVFAAYNVWDTIQTMEQTYNFKA